MPADNSTKTPTRERLIDAAVRRFYRDGFRNVGIDQILTDVGISKTAFYKHFAWNALRLCEGRGRAVIYCTMPLQAVPCNCFFTASRLTVCPVTFAPLPFWERLAEGSPWVKENQVELRMGEDGT